MAKKSACPRFFNIIALIFFCLFLNASAYAQLKGGSEQSLTSLVERFKKAAGLPCGQRDEVSQLSREIIVGYFKDPDNFKTIEWVALQAQQIEKQEALCKTDKSEKPLDELFEEFKVARKQPCGERKQALLLGKEIVERFGEDELNKPAVEYVKVQISRIEPEEKQCREANSLEALFEEYKTLRRQPCGERHEAISLGNRIVNLHGDDELNQRVIVYVERDTAKLKADDYVCRRNALYDQAYKNKYWNIFFSVSREIIDDPKSRSLALDVMLTLVSVGYRLTAYEGLDSYNPETLEYAKKALELIESGSRTRMRWGVFEPFETKPKTLGWLNYVTGYISYFRNKEGKKAIPYFYKATKYDSEFKHDAFVYQAVAIYYFEKEAVTTSSLTVNDFITKANGIGDAVDGDLSPEELAKNREIAMLYKQLVNLYNLRYNLETDENVTGLNDYILKLINRPLVDTAAKDSKYKISAQTK